MIIARYVMNSIKEMIMAYQPTYDLEKRAFLFAKNIRLFIKKLPIHVLNSEDVRQLLRSSGSVGANYIEANESLGKKDFLMHLRISRKEAKESAYWLKLLIDCNDLTENTEILNLHRESIELKKILSAIIEKSK